MKYECTLILQDGRRIRLGIDDRREDSDRCDAECEDPKIAQSAYTPKATLKCAALYTHSNVGHVIGIQGPKELVEGAYMAGVEDERHVHLDNEGRVLRRLPTPWGNVNLYDEDGTEIVLPGRIKIDFKALFEKYKPGDYSIENTDLWKKGQP